MNRPIRLRLIILGTLLCAIFLLSAKILTETYKLPFLDISFTASKGNWLVNVGWYHGSLNLEPERIYLAIQNIFNSFVFHSNAGLLAILLAATLTLRFLSTNKSPLHRYENFLLISAVGLLMHGFLAQLTSEHLLNTGMLESDTSLSRAIMPLVISLVPLIGLLSPRSWNKPRRQRKSITETI